MPNTKEINRILFKTNQDKLAIQQDDLFKAINASLSPDSLTPNAVEAPQPPKPPRQQIREVLTFVVDFASTLNETELAAWSRQGLYAFKQGKENIRRELKWKITLTPEPRANIQVSLGEKTATYSMIKKTLPDNRSSYISGYPANQPCGEEFIAAALKAAGLIS